MFRFQFFPEHLVSFFRLDFHSWPQKFPEKLNLLKPAFKISIFWGWKKNTITTCINAERTEQMFFSYLLILVWTRTHLHLRQHFPLSSWGRCRSDGCLKVREKLECASTRMHKKVCVEVLKEFIRGESCVFHNSPVTRDLSPIAGETTVVVLGAFTGRFLTLTEMSKTPVMWANHTNRPRE